jgi:hypothetical protein
MVKIVEYADFINRKTGKSIHVQIEGGIGTVKYDENIIFTVSGPQSSSTVEAFLSGVVFSLIKLNNQLKK